MPESDVPTPPRSKPSRTGGTARARRGNGRSVLEDVARQAGVSTATVSRVYNDPGKVSAAVRTRVEEAARALNWIPHAAGRALASTRTHIAGIIIPTLDDQVFASQVSGMQATFAEHGITLFLGCSNYAPAQALTQVQAMLARGVEALALVGEAHPPEVFDALQRYRVPYVVTYAYRDDSPHVCVGFDNAAAYEQIVERLVALGHRSFGAVFQPAADNDRVQARQAGLHRALQRHGLFIRPEHQREGPATLAFGRESLRAIMDLDRPRVTASERSIDPAQPPKALRAPEICPPTAIVCGNDMLALGVLREAAARGIAVPTALSVTGFDDLALAAEAHPPLTTMRVDTHRIGRQAAERLLTMMQTAATTGAHAATGTHASNAVSVTTAAAVTAASDRRDLQTAGNRFAPEWLERGSTAAPPLR
ncbi:LacI family DNA-binding transcriptional regulator [Robbsia sp. KACC 23696]|uniref:LacI family DNA-binding transcriptional regulator n=1 Tax=Robbsia sp. KACC 23696 TaxID=3149231 RepID=UPI00325BC8D2